MNINRNFYIQLVLQWCSGRITVLKLYCSWTETIQIQFTVITVNGLCGFLKHQCELHR